MPDERTIRKILIANRGEIAVRVIRSCRELGIRSVAVFSDVDRAALHVRLADEAYHIGPAASTESYLVTDRILETARVSGADAIHPGYGFLSENADFAEACERSDIVFIGPTSESIRAMGDKTTARSLMEVAGVPMAPGSMEAVGNADEATQIAQDIGYPVLIKAAAGGGGKGMRVVAEEEQFSSSLQAAQREALAAFGDGRVFIEKYIVQPRHIEFQIVADTQGNTIHLFERECSIQRRHQKVIEEAPSAIMTADLRERMGKAALETARSCGYVGAGTVEFLVDKERNFYFMEMNTRLQVEHPVTEWITGLDLVAAQIRIAEGRPLPWKQEDLSINGHAIESRVYAEDPANNFLPGPGTLLRHRSPDGMGVRVDAGVEQGDEVPIQYDPLISKLTVWGRTRPEAIQRMKRALAEYEIAGVPTTIPFCRFVMDHEAFTSGNFSTHFVEDHFDGSSLPNDDLALEEALALTASELWNTGVDEATNENGRAQEPFSPWRSIRPRRK